MMQGCTLVIFGGTGDLTKRKLIPAVYRLFCERGQLADFHVLAVGRRHKTDEEYRAEMREAVQAETGKALSDVQWACLAERIGYETLDFAVESMEYGHLENRLLQMESERTPCSPSAASAPSGVTVPSGGPDHAFGNRLYYLAVAPEYFTVIVSHLSEMGMISKKNENGFRRVLVEKPFGTSLTDAAELNRRLESVLNEEDIFRIDHYLGKEMLQNILAVRFGNAVFEPLWNHRHIDHVRIVSHETLGVEGRGGYFDKAGILKDMVQNHLLQMLALVSMEPPVRLDPESIRDEKVKVLRSLRPFTPESAAKDIIRGQYGAGTKTTKSGEIIHLPAYRSEARVSPDSDTETYVLLKTWVDNIRWGGVPFYLESGKRMSRKETAIIIQFKPLSGSQAYPEFGQSVANRLVFSIQPREGFHFAVNGKRPDADWAMDEVIMEYCQSCRADNNSPEAYERLLLEAYRNNAALFARWDELYHSWRFIDTIRSCWDMESTNFPNYQAGTDGPGIIID